MTVSHDDLVALNKEIASRETAGDKAWFDRLLAPEFAMRRASGVHVTRAVFLSAVEPSAPRETSDVNVTHESDHLAMVECMVSMRDGDSERRFQNCRLFTRVDRNRNWQLLAWANAPV
jgi:hypothetical protein